MNIRINLLPRRTIRERVWKTLNVIVAVTTILNATMVGALIRPATATAAVNTQTGNDFHQAANQNPTLGAIDWIGSILQNSNSKYFEGMSTPQRIVFTNVETTANNEHTIVFSHQANKGSIHAYDFITSWTQAVAAANDIAPGQGLLSGLMSNPCGSALSANGTTACNALISGANFVDVAAPDAMGTVESDNVAARVTAYETKFGNRTIRLYGNSAISNASVTFDGYTGSGDKEANYTLHWTSTSSNVMVQLAGHLSVTGNGTGISYPAPKGSANINGGPYHFHLESIDGDTTGRQDNQIKGADIVISPAHIIVNKVTVPANDPGQFSITASGNGTITAPATKTVTTSTPADFTVTAGTYSITESVPAGWAKTDDCQGIVIAAGETKTCTITNTKQEFVLAKSKSVANLTDASRTTVANPPYVGDILQYTLHVANSGNIDATNQTFTDTVSDVLKFASGPNNISNGGSYSAPTITWNSITVPHGGAVDLTFTVTVKPVANWSTGPFKLVNTFNNTVITPLCHLTIEKKINGQAGPLNGVGATDTLNYTIVVTNDGTGNCTGGGIKVVDSVSSNLDLATITDGVRVHADLGYQGIPWLVGNVLTWNANTLAPGETATINWSAQIKLSARQCGPFTVDNTATAFPAENPAGVQSNTVTASGNHVCYGTLRVHKVTDPANDTTTEFDIHATTTNGSIVGSPDETITGGSYVDYTVTPGDYTVTEDALAGWNKNDTNCASVNVSAGQTAECTIYNTKLGTIIIYKNTTGGNGTFSFTTTGGGNFPATFDITTVANTGSRTFTDIDPSKSYSVDEIVPTGWDLNPVTCSTGTNSSFTVAPGGTTTCTFGNVQRGHLIVHKVTVPASDNSAFEITASGTGSITGPAVRTISGGQSVDYEVVQGMYTVDETPISGWDQDDKACVDLNVNAGQTVECTITNTKLGSITITKETVPNTAQDLFSFTGDITTSIGNGGSASSWNLMPGVYTVTEAAKTDWALTQLVCSDGNSVGDLTSRTATFNLEAGENITCTFTNTRDTGTIKIIKNVVGGTATAADWTFTVGSTSGILSGQDVTLPTGDYPLWEFSQVLGYSFTDLDGICDFPNPSTAAITVNAVAPAIGVVHVTTQGGTCTVTNTRDTGTIIVHKQVDTDGNGTFDVTDDTAANALGFRWSIDGGLANRNMGGSVDVTTIDSHVVAENTVTGYHAVGWFYDNNEGSCTDRELNQLPATGITVNKNGTTSITICNARDTAKLTVIKIVNNNNLGTKVVSDFPLFVGTTGVTSGVQNMFGTGMYTVSETNQANYASVITGDCAADGAITLTANDVKTCTITNTYTVVPNLQITKSNNIVGFTNPGKTVTYTVTITNAMPTTEIAKNVSFTDTLPNGFTFVDTGLGTKTFPLFDLAPGASKTFVYDVNINGFQPAGVYTNTATAKGSNTGTVTATSNVDVRVPQVFGATSEPALTITKTVSPTTSKPGDIVTYTVTVKNIGDADATNVSIADTLPSGFTFVDTGLRTRTFNLGTIEPSHTRVIHYDVKVGSAVKAGAYKNLAVLTADGLEQQKAQATVTIKVPQVLGLATTGAGLRDLLVFLGGLSLAGIGLYLARSRRHGAVTA